MANTGKYEYIRLENGILSVQRTNSIAKLLEKEFDSYESMDITLYGNTKISIYAEEYRWAYQKPSLYCRSSWSERCEIFHGKCIFTKWDMDSNRFLSLKESEKKTIFGNLQEWKSGNGEIRYEMIYEH